MRRLRKLVCDGLKGFAEAIEAVFPQAAVQTCIVHLIRNSLDFVSWKDRKPVVAELGRIYRAADAEAERKALEAFEDSAWGRKYAAISQIWRRQWEQIILFFAFAPAVRKIIYTTNAIEALNAKLRRAVRARGHFPNDEAATKLTFLVLRQIARQWKMPPPNGPRQKPSSPSCSASASSGPDENPAPRTSFPTLPTAVATQPPLRVEIVKRPDDASGFVVLPRRWVVEPTFSWFGRNRRLAKDDENLADTLAAFITLACIQLALRRLARR